MKRDVRISIRKKMLLLCAATAVPFLILIIYLVISMVHNSKTYGNLVSNMTIANNYNLNFKEEMDESLYKLVVGYISFDEIGNDQTLKDPYVLIHELRNEFTKLMGITTGTESKFWLRSLLRNINTLEKRVDDIKESLDVGGRYQENIENLDNNIYILTELIQDDIQYYIYYQTKSMENVNHAVNQQINDSIVLCAILIGALVLVVSVVSLLIVTGIQKPLRVLYHATEKVAKGDFTARAQVNTHDEFAVLSQGFNIMAENIESLIDKVKEDERKLRQVDLRILQEQINPHFLYNTLDTIVWLIEGNEYDKAVNMVVTLSDFFRIVLSKGREIITIQEEQQHIRSYLEIQQVRYHDILEYDIQIDKVLYEYPILKLTLQPIVENALYHGIKYKRAKGYIHITGEKEGGVLHLVVRDNGVGIEKEELEQIQREIRQPGLRTEKGFGLANVNERIRMYYGAEYGVTIQSKPGKGTIVEVTIPAKKFDTEGVRESLADE